MRENRRENKMAPTENCESNDVDMRGRRRRDDIALVERQEGKEEEMRGQPLDFSPDHKKTFVKFVRSENLAMICATVCYKKAIYD